MMLFALNNSEMEKNAGVHKPRHLLLGYCQTHLYGEIAMKKILMIAAATACLSLVGCATYDTGYGSGYGYNQSSYNNSYRGNYSRSQPWSAADEGKYFNDGSRVVCRNVEVGRDSADPNRVGGTIAGAIIGGVIGNQFGSGSGRTAATAAGAIAGGAVGRNVQGRNQEYRGEVVVQRQCERVWR